MIGEEAIRSILSQYKKFGWELRYVLLTPELNATLSTDLTDLINASDVRISDIDAAWFSRPSRGDQTAWELRRLSELPYALIAVVDGEEEPDELETILRQTEDDLRERINNAPPTS